MKMVIVAPEVFPVPPVRGGAVETVIEEVSAQLRDHEVTILGIADASLPLHETKEHRTYRRWRRGWLARLLLSSWKLPFKQSGSPWYYWPYQRWITRQIAQLRPDVVWVHSRIQFVPAIRRAAPRARLILSLHNESNLEGDAVWTSAAVDAVDVITGCSRFLTQAIEQRRPRCQGKTVVLYNGVNPDVFAPRWAKAEERHALRQAHDLLERPVVLYVGRLVEAKGVHLLVEAFARLVDRGIDATLVIAGSHTFSDGRKTHYIEELRKQAPRLGDRVRFLGHVSRGEIHRYFLMSDVLAFPSIWQEPFGMVILEAQAAGLPVIAFDQGGPSEIIRHGKNGVLVSKEEGAAGFADALAQCLSDSTMREVLGREARWSVEERFTWSSMAENLLTLCDAGDTSHGARVAPCRVLIAESGSGYGGSAKYLSDLVSLLDRRRYDVRVVAAEDGPFIKKVGAQHVPVAIRYSWRFPWGRGIAGVPVIGPIVYAVTAAVQLFLTVPMMAAWLTRERIQVVHLNNELLSHVPLAVAARLAGCKVVCHLHGWRPLTSTERWAARFIDEFVCISEAGAAFHRDQLEGRSVQAIPNGIVLNGQVNDLEAKRRQQRQQLGVQESDVVVAIIGRLVPWKGQERYLQALASVSQRHPEVVGLVVGHDASPGQRYLAQLQSMARAHGFETSNITPLGSVPKLGISAEITRLGTDPELRISEMPRLGTDPNRVISEPKQGRVCFVSWIEDVWAIYAAADIVVHASTQPEPFGLVLIEAMAAGKPVIATRAGGVVDIVTDGDTGLLVEPGDIDRLAHAITRLLGDRALADRLGQRGANVARTTFTMERNAAQVAAVYDRLAGAPQ